MPCSIIKSNQCNVQHRPTDFSCGGADSPSAMQSITMGLSRWLPVHGGAYIAVDPYSYRSVYGQCPPWCTLA